MTASIRRRGGGVALCLTLLASGARANPSDVPRSVQEAVRAATVEVLPARCAGAVAEVPELVVTARHCAKTVGDEVTVRVAATGRQLRAWVAAVDETADQAVLLLDGAAAVAPLDVARRAPIEGTVLFFAGNPRQPKWQSLRLDRVAPCPSLPGLANALFTSLRGAPGDSGAPLVDGAGRIIGLVHGGARCQIATPGDRLVRLLDRVLGVQPA
jgi:S1-C subfamily serine protease